MQFGARAVEVQITISDVKICQGPSTLLSLYGFLRPSHCPMLASVAGAPCRLGYRPARPWLRAFFRQSADQLHAFEMRELSMMADAVSRARFAPPRPWVTALQREVAARASAWIQVLPSSLEEEEEEEEEKLLSAGGAAVLEQAVQDHQPVVTHSQAVVAPPLSHTHRGPPSPNELYSALRSLARLDAECEAASHSAGAAGGSGGGRGWRRRLPLARSCYEGGQDVAEALQQAAGIAGLGLLSVGRSGGGIASAAGLRVIGQGAHGAGEPMRERKGRILSLRQQRRTGQGRMGGHQLGSHGGHRRISGTDPMQIQHGSIADPVWICDGSAGGATAAGATAAISVARG